MDENQLELQVTDEARERVFWVHDLAWDGRGVARRRDGRVLMIFGALPGDTVQVEIENEPDRGPIDATAVTLVEESPQRVPHPCPHYERGCPASQLGAVRRESSLEWKRDHLVETLRRIGGLDGVVVEPVIPSPQQWRYRERLEFHLERGRDGLDVGYVGRHGLVPIHDCRIGSLALRGPLMRLRGTLPELDAHPHLGARVPLRLLLRDDGRGGAIAVLFVLTRGPVDSRPLEEWFDGGELSGWEIRRARNRKLRFVNSELVITKGDPTARVLIAGRELTLPSIVFSQVNRAAGRELLALVLDHVSENGRLLDLFGGFGWFGIEYAARGGSAVVVDSAPAALEAGRRFAHEAALDVELVERDLSSRSVADLEPASFDAAILDPPRAGADKRLLDVLNESGPDRLIYVSCHPAALARDIQRLRAYATELIVPIDMFPSTSELETVVILDRRG